MLLTTLSLLWILAVFEFAQHVIDCSQRINATGEDRLQPPRWRLGIGLTKPKSAPKKSQMKHGVLTPQSLVEYTQSLTLIRQGSTSLSGQGGWLLPCRMASKAQDAMQTPSENSLPSQRYYKGSG